eukprot:7340521-Alexandrium_andersonii.AAC.1
MPMCSSCHPADPGRMSKAAWTLILSGPRLSEACYSSSQGSQLRRADGVVCCPPGLHSMGPTS